MSPPRVVPVVELGCKDGGSYDIQNGWDFTDEECQNQCILEMELAGVDAVIVTPPCDQFSRLQNLSNGKGYPIVR
ncbi:MAG: hypothetical protein NLN65_07875, partial [Candidatus Poseidoniaceae archaeon]|nr:hypothetical protein [Candidatus Poseidoniaceae archaeon]